MKTPPASVLNPVLQITRNGLFCPAGDFHIDPWRPVERAVITHAHADHARGGSRTYLCARSCTDLLRARLGDGTAVQSLGYGEPLRLGGVTLSLHPAGHVRGSAQVRIAQGGYVCVVSGDTKTAPDPTCAPLEPLPCHYLLTEATFGLPVFRWPDPARVFEEINAWWRTNQAEGRTSVLFAYALGKAQRIMAGLDASIGPILTHGAVEKISRIYREAGIALPATRHVDTVTDRRTLAGALVIAPPAGDHPAWLRRFPARSRAFASGWMRIRGNRRRRAMDRGFVLSDHSDWDGLLRTVAASRAEAVGVTHGYAAEMSRWLTENGWTAAMVPSTPPAESARNGDAG